jgi:hypothetical protein
MARSKGSKGSKGSGGPKRIGDVPTGPWDVGVDRVRRARNERRVLLALLAAVVLAGAAGLLGARTSTVSASGAGYELSVSYPAVTRPGLAIRWMVVVRHPGGFAKPINIATTSAYFNLFDFNNLDPTPSGAITDAQHSIWTFDPPAGDILRVTMDARLEPARQSGNAATTSVLVEGLPVVSVSYHTAVVP